MYHIRNIVNCVIQKLARLEGFEPPTLDLEERVSVQLNYKQR